MSVPSTLTIEKNGTAWLYWLNCTTLGEPEDGATVTCTTLVDETGTEVPTSPDIWPLTLPLISDADHLTHLTDIYGDDAPATGEHYGARVTGVTTWPRVGSWVKATITIAVGSDSKTVYPRMQVKEASGVC